MKLVECIPNVSEGRRAGLVADLGAAISATTGVRLLHVHADVDHNRSVFTVVGAPEAMVEAMDALYETAFERIDLTRHTGAHPRIGAVDVCPFVALPGFESTPDDCVAMARSWGEAAGTRFEVPVFLYRDAATRDGRRDLASVRRGGLEGLATRLGDPEWIPDFGPTRPHPSAGATAIGARGPLVAYNMVLDTDDVDAAREIASLVRASSGGMRGIKALGVPLDSRRLVQVSMNIEDPVATPIEVVSEEVEAQARLRGYEVRETELVGLVPSALVTPAARSWLERGEFDDRLILENAIEASGITST